jgi:hypothetical protein
MVFEAGKPGDSGFKTGGFEISVCPQSRCVNYVGGFVNQPKELDMKAPLIDLSTTPTPIPLGLVRIPGGTPVPWNREVLLWN